MKNIMNTISAVINREFKEIIWTKQILFTTVLGPLLALLITVGIFYNGVVSNAAIGIINLDNSEMSRDVIRKINSVKSVEVTHQFNSETEAIKAVKNGDIYGFVIIDSEFEKKILKGEQTAVKCYINGLNVMIASTIENGIYNVVANYSATINTNKYMKGGNNKTQAILNAAPLKVDSHTLYNPFKSFSYFLTVAVLPLMLLAFIFLTSVYSLGIELKRGTAAEFMKLVQGKRAYLFIKLLPYTVIYSVWGFIYSMVEIEILSVPVTKTVTLLLLAYVILILTYQAMAIVMVALTSNMRLSLSLGSAYTMMALTFAGVTFPSMAMDAVAQGFGTIFPYFYVIQGILLATLKDGNFAEFLTVIYPAGIYIALGFIAVLLLGKRYSNPQFYYKD